MGAADIIPGVSGGTIAFITGIYEELLGTISGFKPKLFQTLRSQGLKATWKEANASFLVALVLGILIAAASLSHVISYLLENHGVLLWSFFFVAGFCASSSLGKK